MTEIGPHYHSAFVVPDLEAAMESFGTALGLTWTAVRDGQREIHLPASVHEVRVRVAFSIQGPPYVELIERVPGSIWDPSGPHHVGVWVDDVAAASARLEAEGLSRAAHMCWPDGARWRIAYHHAPGGGYVELVDERVRPELEARLAGRAV
jgi:hypothetical protein